MFSRSSRALALLSISALVPIAHAGVLWNETIQGDLSNNWLNPTDATLSLGDNSVLGSTGDSGTGDFDRDYLTITIPQGMLLTELILVDYFSTDQSSFIGVNPGETTIDPDLATPSSLLGWTLFGSSSVGNNLFNNLSIPRYPGGGFISPVGPGTYTFWIQQTGEETLYELNFVTIPSPASAAIALLLLRRPRRS